MAILLKQNTTSQEIPLGYFVDSTDGNTEETSLTINNTDIKLWKSGTSTLVNKNSGGASHISNGIYYATLDDTDTNTLGPLVVFVHVAGALAIRVECLVLPSNVHMALVSGTTYLDVNAVQIEGSDATDQILNAVVDDYTRIDASAMNILSGKAPTGNISDFDESADRVTISGTKNVLDDLNDPTAADVADAVWNEVASGHTDEGKAGQQLWTDIDAILVDTDEIQGKLPSSTISDFDETNDKVVISGTKSTLDDLNDISTADVNTEVDNALNTAIPVSPTTDSINERVKAIDDKLPTGTLSDFDESTDKVVVITNQDKTGYTISGAKVSLDALNDFNHTADQVIVATNNDKTGYSISGSKTTLDVLNDITVSGVWYYATRLLTGATNITSDGATIDQTKIANLDQSIFTTESNIRGVDSDTLKTLSDEIDTITPSGVADQVWNEAKSEHTLAGSFGEEVQAHSLSTEVSAVETDTQDIQSRLPAALISGMMNSYVGGEDDTIGLTSQEKIDVNLQVDTALSDYDPPTKSELDTMESNIRGVDSDTLKSLSDAIDALKDFDPSSDTVTVSTVTSAGIQDIWSTDTLSEAYATSGQVGTPAQILYMILQLLSERNLSGTTLTIKKLDGSTAAMTFTLDDADEPTSQTRTS